MMASIVDISASIRAINALYHNPTLIGALHWLRNHELMVRKTLGDGFNLLARDDRESQAIIAGALQCAQDHKTQLDLNTLQMIGQKEIDANTVTLSRASLLEVQVGVQRLSIAGLPIVAPARAWEVDGTHFYTEDDQTDRILSGPTDQGVSAIDSILWLMILLDAGRTRADQTVVDLNHTGLAVTLVDTVRERWSELSTQRKNELRDNLAHVASQVNTGLKDKDPAEVDIFNAICLLGGLVGQLHATWTEAVRCCESGPWGWQLDAGPVGIRSTTRLGLQPDTEEVGRMMKSGNLGWEKFLQNFLEPHPYFPGHDEYYPPSCGRESCCQRNTAQQQRVILDRPPQTLTIGDNASILLRRAGGVFHDVSLTFAVRNQDGIGQEKTDYTFFAAILRGSGRYIICFNGDALTRGRRLFIYDSLHNDGNIQELTSSLVEFCNHGKWEVTNVTYARLK